MAPYLAAFIAPIALLPLRKKNSLAYIAVLSTLWALFAGLRLDIGGIDYFGYRDFYHSLQLQGTVSSAFEPLFIALAHCMVRLRVPYHGFLIVVALLQVLPAIYVIERRAGSAAPLGLFVYGIEFMFESSFIILRQGIAVGIAFLILDALLDKKIIRPLLLAALAVGFHYSAVLLFIYPLLIFEYSPRLRTALFLLAAALGAMLIGALMLPSHSWIATHISMRYLDYLMRGLQAINPLNYIEALLVAWIIRRYGSELPPLLKNAFFVLVIFVLYGAIDGIVTRMISYFKIGITLIAPYAALASLQECSNKNADKHVGKNIDGRGLPRDTIVSRIETTLIGYARRLLGPSWLSVAIFCYYLAKITRWLILNANVHGGFLPYRTIL